MTKSKIVVGSVVLAAAVAFFLCRRGACPQSEAETARPGAAVASSAPASAPVAAAVATNQTPTVRGTLPYVLTSKAPFDKPLRLAVESLGARAVCVLGPSVVLVEADAAARSRLLADGRFESLVERRPADKVQDRLAAALSAGAASVEAAVVALSAEDRQRLIDCIVSGGGELLKGCVNEGATIRARLPSALAAALSRRGDVRWLEQFERPHLMNDLAVNAGAMNVRPAWELHGLSGAGQVVSTSDSGIDTGDLATLHPDLRERVAGFKVVDGCSANDVDGHGTHTAGSIVGDGRMSDGRIRGSAWGATLYAWFCDGGDDGVLTPGSMSELFRGDAEGAEWPAYVHSASWGRNLGGAYDTQCADFDRYVWEHPDFLPVIAAGNMGPNPLTVASPAAAKNVLAVGATENLRADGRGSRGFSNGRPANTASYSSQGPCRDGRIKPDIAAPGTGVLSTRAAGVDYAYGNYDRYYAYDTGTSMACPLTAGAVALTREWLVANATELGLSPTEPPTAALMKAVVTGGAAGGLLPDGAQGWGRVDLAETLFPSNRAVRLIDRIPFAAGSNFVYVIETTNAAPLEVQLVWVDYPGDAEDKTSARKLVNDLDLTVEARLGLGDDRVWRGNGGERPDRLNNLESVRIETAAATKYVITVSCPQIVHDHTEGGAAALYVRGAFDPAAEPEIDYTVRIRERDLGFRDFGAALAAVRDHETVELLDWVYLPSNVVVQTSFVLTATNAAPSATPILRRNDASMTLAEGATVYFTNVAFAAGGSAAVRVAQGAKARVAGTAVFDGLIAGVPGLAVAAPSGFELAGRLDNGITIDCTGASLPGAQFGRYACAAAVAEECAPRLVSAAETTWSGRADGEGRLCWAENAPVDPAVAVGYVDGETPVYCRTLDQLIDATPAGATAVVQRSGYPLARLRTLSGALTLAAAEGAGEIVVKPAEGAGLKLADGADLTVSGLAFCDYTGNAVFTVDGDAARLTLTNVAFRNIEGTNTHSGAVYVRRGAVRSIDTVFEDCRATGDYYVRALNGALLKRHVNSFGGAVFLAGDGCALELSGGAVSNCQARTYGGGVYAKAGAAVSVAGALSVRGNSSGNHERDDLYLMSGAELALGGAMTGRSAVGIRYFVATTSPAPAFGNDVGDDCARLAATVDRSTAVASAPVFFNDAYPDTTEAQLAATGDRLHWVAREPGDLQVEPDDPSAAIAVAKGGVTRYYADAVAAFDWIDDEATVELLKDVAFAGDLVVPNGVSVCLRSRSPGSFVLRRGAADAAICVLPGATLSVTNLEVNGGGVVAASSLLRVDGGALELRAGASVRNAYGAEVRAAGGVSVWNGGSFVLLDGAVIADCVNASVVEDGSAGYGGGLLVENATADLRGGRITAGRARRGGGVFAGSKAKLYLSGDVTIADNATVGGAADVLAAAADNLCVADLTELVVTGELTGEIGYNEGVSRDPEVFGKATFTGAAAQASAHRFTHDVSGDVGMAVTDGSETLLVWSQALDDAGGYGDGYALIAGEPVAVYPPAAVAGLVYDGQVQTGVVAGVGYALAGHTAVDAGDYLATASLRAGFVWAGGATAPVSVPWGIAKGVYDLSGVVFADGTFAYDGTFHYLALAGTLPAGLLVSYENNGRYQPGTNVVTAIIAPDPDAPSPNLELSPNPTTMTARLIVVDAGGLYPGDGEDPSVVTRYPSPIAIRSIDRLPDGKWQIVVTNREPYCWYCLISTDDLKRGFTSTGAWQQAAADAPKAWTSVVERAEGQYFWRALGKPGEGPATP